MAYDNVRTQLDQLLGGERDGGYAGVVSIRTKERGQGGARLTKYWDPNVCKHFLAAGFCPNKLFANTKADLGACTKLHSDDLRQEYMSGSAQLPTGMSVPPGYERDLTVLCADMVSDVDRRIGRAVRRLQTQYGIDSSSAIAGSPLARLTVLSTAAMRQVAREVRGDEIDKDDEDDDDDDRQSRDSDASGSDSEGDETGPAGTDAAGALGGIRILATSAAPGTDPVGEGGLEASKSVPPDGNATAAKLETDEPKKETDVSLDAKVEPAPVQNEPTEEKALPATSKDEKKPEAEKTEVKKEESLSGPDNSTKGDDTNKADQAEEGAQDAAEVPGPPAVSVKKWKEYKTPEGKLYWHDAQSGVSTWEKPDEEDIDREKPSDGGDEMEEGEEPEPLDPLKEKRNKLRVCKTCGAFLSIFDSEKRLNDHFAGKMHVGYVAVREELEKRRKPPRFAIPARPDRTALRDDDGDRRGYKRGRFDDQRGPGYDRGPDPRRNLGPPPQRRDYGRGGFGGRRY